jgi:serpin B
MRIKAVPSIMLAGLLLAVACSDGTGPHPPEAITSLPRQLTNVEQSIVSANNAFTIALFQEASAAEPKGNVFISPLSASMALGMALNGARTTTFDAMRSALQFGELPQSDINSGYQSLMSLLMGLDPTIESHVANSIWYRSDLPVDPAFAAAAESYFDAQVEPLDFAKGAESLARVNGWVDDRTSGRIPSILDAINPDDVMYLINAIYFKASWRTAFDRDETLDAAFTSGDGEVETVPMMHLDQDGFAAREWPDGTMMAELPYGNTAFNMQVYLPPDTSSVEHFVERMTLDDLGGASPGHLRLWMPRLKLEYERHLNADLAGLGMGIAFTDMADFSGITTAPMGLFMSDVLQKTFLSIDEEGTEAAAVTKVTFVDSASPPAVVIRCDRPYLIVIRERLSGTILFIGKINTI